MNAPIRFAQISDTHVRPDAIERTRVSVDLLAEVQAGAYDFVIHTGDLMDEPSAWSARALRALVSPLQVPIHFVPGNHDVYNPHMGEIEAPWWAKLEVDSSLEAQYRGWFGPAWHATSYSGVHLVGIDSLIVNSGLPEETEQWAWLEDTLTGFDGHDEQIVLFTHLPLFIWQPDEELDADDFANRYLVIAPPGRDRLLDLIRRHRVKAVLSGHLHVPWQRSHTWPEGFATRFVCTGSSGASSTMAIEQFDLPLGPSDGLGYQEHRLAEEGLSSGYHPYKPAPDLGGWSLGQAWTTRCPIGQTPPSRDGHQWMDVSYRPLDPEWQESGPAATLALEGRGGETLCVRQAFEATDETVDLYLELCTEREVEIYLNGGLVCKLAALDQWPGTWQSAGGTYSIDSPLLHVGLNQRLVCKGQNLLTLQVRGEPMNGSRAREYVAYRRLESGMAPNEMEAGVL